MPKQHRFQSVETLTRAFGEDPLVKFISPSVQNRESWLRSGMTLFYELSHRTGKVHTTENHEGVLCVIPPGSYPFSRKATYSSFARSSATLPFCSLCPLPHLRDFLKLLRFYEKKHIDGPHWYILLIGVDPAQQKKGFSRELLQPILEQADKDQLPCYLENSNPKNLVIYQKFGFEVIEEAHFTPKSPPLWLMIRSPKNPTNKT